MTAVLSSLALFLLLFGPLLLVAGYFAWTLTPFFWSKTGDVSPREVAVSALIFLCILLPVGSVLFSHFPA